MVEEHPFPIGLAVHELSRLIRREVEARTREVGFTEGQLRTMWQLGRNQGISQARLADLLETQPISLVRVLDRLEAAALIERRPDPRDRRAVQLYLTPAGEETLERAKVVVHEIDNLMTRHIDKADIDHLLRTFLKIRAVFEGPADAPVEAKVG